MKVLVINAGSSSLKYQLIDMQGEKVMAKGNCERIGIDGYITHKTGEDTEAYDASFPTHAEAFQELVKLLTGGKHPVIGSMAEISAVGHRVVQGGEGFNTSALITEEMLKTVETFNDLAPLHNPANIMAIRACQSVLDKSIPQVAVFDTAFHQTLPKHAYLYAIPYELYEKHRIRRYGFHGTSHRYVSGQLAKVMGKPLSELKIVTCHLGNGSSIAAVSGGKSVDTSMGFTPVAGIPMGTRCGDIDPAIVTFLQEKEGMGPKDVDALMNKKSGYLGVSGVTSDQRDLTAEAEKGNERCKLAMEMQEYQIKKYIGAYAAAMNGLDAVVFTGGIGENSAKTRAGVCKDMEWLGIQLDEAVNEVTRGVDKELSKPGSRVKVYTIATNEELLIAQDTVEVAGKK